MSGAIRAQSEPIGVLLLTGIVVLSMATVGVVVFGQIQGSETTRADVSVLVTHDGVSLSHGGGDAVPLSALRVVVTNDSGTWEPVVDTAGVVDGDSDGTFEPGERWVGRRSLAETVTTVYVFDNRTGTLLEKATRYPTRAQKLTHTPSDTPGPTPESTPSPTETATATPTDGTGNGGGKDSGGGKGNPGGKEKEKAAIGDGRSWSPHSGR